MALTINSAQYNSGAEYETVTGEIVTIDNAKPYVRMKQVVCEINPVQDLHGYANPWSAGGSANKLPTANWTVVTGSGITFTVNNDGSITLNGTSNELVVIDGDVGTWQWDGTSDYWLSGCPAGGNANNGYSLRVDSITNSAWSNYDVGNGAKLSNNSGSLAEKPLKFRIVIRSGVNVTGKVFKPMLNAGLSAQPFAPYSNICPISGWSSAKVTRTGANVCEELFEDGLITASGGYAGYQYAIRSRNFNPCVPGESYYYKITSGISGANIAWYDVEKNFIQRDNDLANAIFTAPSNAYFFKLSIYNYKSVNPTYSNDISINYPSTDTAYHQYVGNTFTISLGDTRYGAVLDAVRGKLRVTKYYYTFTGDETFLHNESAWGAYAYLFNTAVNMVSSNSDTSVMSSHFKRGNYSGWGALVPNDFIIASNTYIGLGYNGTANELKAYLSGQVTAGTPVQVIGTLATPIEVDVDPEAIKTVDGINNIWADCGDIEVEYCADTKLYIDKKLA